MIAAKKEDCIEYTTYLTVIDAPSQELTNDDVNGAYGPSSIEPLCLYKLRLEKNESGRTWGRYHCNSIKASNTNLINPKIPHFGSDRYYYSYDNKGMFSMVNDSSVEQYVRKKLKKKLKTIKTTFNSAFVEEMCSHEMRSGIK